MATGILYCLLLFLIWVTPDVEADAKAYLVDQGTCGDRLISEVMNIKDYKPVVTFDDEYISIEPTEPTIPGCFKLNAKNVTVASELNTIIGDFVLRIGDSPDADAGPRLDCQKPTSQCPCIANRSCLYCDFCEKFKEVLPGARASKSGALDKQDAKCSCKVERKKYDLSVEVCTPTAEELQDVLPKAVISQASSNSKFTLFTTLYIYGDVYSVDDNVLTAKQKEEAISNIVKTKLIGCHVIVTNINVL